MGARVKKYYVEDLFSKAVFCAPNEEIACLSFLKLVFCERIPSQNQKFKPLVPGYIFIGSDIAANERGYIDDQLKMALTESEKNAQIYTTEPSKLLALNGYKELSNLFIPDHNFINVAKQLGWDTKGLPFDIFAFKFELIRPIAKDLFVKIY